MYIYIYVYVYMYIKGSNGRGSDTHWAKGPANYRIL